MTQELIKVLLVDDDHDEYVIVRDLVEKIEPGGFQLSWEPASEQALATIARREHDVYLLDCYLGEHRGLKLLREAMSQGRTAPLVLLIGRPDDNGEAGAIRAAMADFSFRHRLDAVMLEHSLRYAVERKKVEEALREKDEQLRRGQKLEAIGRLASGVAHEFSNLLQAVLGYTRYAMQGLPPEDGRCQDLQQVVNAAERAVGLTQQLLGFGRRQDLQRVDLDLNQIAADVVKLLRPLLGEHIAITMALGERAGTIRADAGAIQQMLVNLCINARDAMPSGGQLLVKTERVVLGEDDARLPAPPRPGRYALVTVADTGHGMTADVKEHLFEPFFTTKPGGAGTGLGLAMVYDVVQQHGGSIDVDSRPGQGTTVRVYFPTTEPAVEVHIDERLPPPPGGTETVLVAEDDPLVRDLAARALREAGYTVLVARDGQEALEVFAQHRGEVSLLLLDAVMPEWNGYEVYRRIKGEGAEVSVLFCTGYRPEVARSRFAIDEDLPLLQKPMDPEILLRTVRDILDRVEACLES